MKEKVKELLGMNLKPVVVASAVGVSESYISQLLSDAEFSKEVQELKLRNLSETIERDKRWDGLEDGLLQRLEDILPMGFTRPMELLRALQVVNAAKRRSTPQEAATATSMTIVPLLIPAVVASKFVANAQGQVVEVEGRTIATMPASVVAEKLLEKDTSRAKERLDSLAKLDTLPVHEVV